MFSAVRPKLSIIVVIYDMHREAERTLYSLTTKFQKNIRRNIYEVLVIDNGSIEPFSSENVKKIDEKYQYYYIENASPSPAKAINYAVNKSKGEYIAIMIDGARIVTPGVLDLSMKALSLYPNAVVSTIGYHIGPGLQSKTVSQGYSQEAEDTLLKSIDWMKNGYKLFDISVLAGSTKDGWFLPIAESNFFVLRKTLYKEVEGYDEEFSFPGGGFINLDFYKRVVTRKDVDVVLLLGEGTFHQIHGGESTNVNVEELQKRLAKWHTQYKDIRGFDYSVPYIEPVFFGKINKCSYPHLIKSLLKLDEHIKK